MTGNEVYEVLIRRGVSYLHHANSLITSTSLLNLGGLASRELVEARNLPQTYQYTDQSDKNLGVWGDIFLDTVDIHKRASRRNNYGPILFVVNAEILKLATNVLITKSNPSKWNTQTPHATRYFTSTDELEEGLAIGEFDQMLTLRTSNGLLPLAGLLEYILVDDPIQGPQPGPEFTQAQNTLMQLTDTPIIRRECQPWCKCSSGYSDAQVLSKMFSPC
ncbi:hypothetical protein ABE525_25455 [Pseudomonas wadenswilerensis]|uniref:hypothetical protein n=1 Tax=Pseudomonas wadenswilerensis TaxID=1785161 RepID=UPI003207B6EC